MLMLILFVVLVFALVGAGVGHSRVGYVGWSPAGIILALIAVLYFTGNLHYTR